MNKKHQVHNLIILDESGSMQSIKPTIIAGFNELVQTIQGIEKQFPDQEHTISFLTFNSLGQKFHHFNHPVAKLQKINEKNYNPDSGTPLFDAMGHSLLKVKHHLEGQTDYNVLVTILTDGEENASKEFSGADIKKLVEELQKNTMTFEKNEADIKNMWLKESSARASYSEKIRLKEDTSTGYFEGKKDKK